MDAPRRSAAVDFLDESGAHLAMGRSHVWVKRGEGVCGTPADDWGDNLTMIGAIRQDGLLTLCTKWRCSITSRSSLYAFPVRGRSRLAKRAERLAELHAV
jgi:hypothetical protein